MVASAMIADLNVGGAIANSDFVSEAMTARALCEGFRVDGDLHGDALVVHIRWFGKELTECRTGGVVYHDMNSAGR